MHSAIAISSINDFIFCPKSLYLHSIYSSFHYSSYHQPPQINGALSHSTIESQKYSTSAHIIMALPIYSAKYDLIGKIDIYNKKSQTLIERKYRLKKIFDGHIYQLQAQYLCMSEMGYKVSQLKIHSLKDNKSYDIPLPTTNNIKQLQTLLTSMREYTISTGCPKNITPNKCANCIYSVLCDSPLK